MVKILKRSICRELTLTYAPDDKVICAELLARERGRSRITSPAYGTGGGNLHPRLSATIGQPERAELRSHCIIVVGFTGDLFRLGRTCGPVGSAEIWNEPYTHPA